MSLRTADTPIGVRREAVVVLCRGQSRRLGRPKALACTATDPRPMLRRVVELYAGFFAGPVLVVTTEALRQDCTALVADLPAVRVAGGPAGGDTARTLGLAWDDLRRLVPPYTHIWVHPVDLPLVGPRTLAQLGAVSAAAPTRVVRPTWAGQPGHPVILPVSVLCLFAPEAHLSAGPWRDLMQAAVVEGRLAPPVTVAVADPGVILDHDGPGDGL